MAHVGDVDHIGGAAYLEKCRVIIDLVESAETDAMEARLTPRGNLRLNLPLSFGLKRIAPLLPAFQKAYSEINLALDFTDRFIDLIEEGVDLSIRITARLDPGNVARKLGTIRLLAVASPDYLKQYGRPAHPHDLSGHCCLGYSAKVNNRPLVFSINGVQENIYVPYRLQANNGEALVQAAAQGVGITVQPDFIVEQYVKEGTLETILGSFEPPPWGSYAIWPSNRYLPQRVRVLIEFLASELAQTDPESIPETLA